MGGQRIQLFLLGIQVGLQIGRSAVLLLHVDFQVGLVSSQGVELHLQRFQLGLQIDHSALFLQHGGFQRRLVGSERIQLWLQRIELDGNVRSPRRGCPQVILLLLESGQQDGYGRTHGTQAGLLLGADRFSHHLGHRFCAHRNRCLGARLDGFLGARLDGHCRSLFCRRCFGDERLQFGL